MKLADTIAKGVFFAVIWIACALAIFRGAVPYLWGARSDFSTLAAVLVGAVAAAALIMGAARMIGAIQTDLNQKDDQ